MQTELFQAPCVNDAAREHFQRTVVDGVSIQEYGDYTNREFGDRIPIWGASSGADKYIEQMSDGDFIIFYTGDETYRYAATVAHTEYNPDLASALWEEYDSSLREGDGGWPYVIYLSNLREINMDSADLHQRAGYKINYTMNFRRTNDDGVRNVEREFGSVRAYIRSWEQSPQRDGRFEEEQRELYERLDRTPELTEADEGHTESARPVRSGAFRQAVKEAYDYSCAFCGAERKTPTGRPEVEAAHIYPRSENGADDIRNGLALCKLHHWAFDNGWVSITEQHEILVKDRPEVAGYNDFEPLRGEEIRLPDDERCWPAKIYLREHQQLFGFGGYGRVSE